MLQKLRDQNNEDAPVLVIGAASIDIVGRTQAGLIQGSSTPANIRTSHGGTARNFAENLARLGQPVTLLTVVGKDQTGRNLIKHTTAAGVNTDHIIKTKNHPTSSYLAVVNPDGELHFALDDMRAASLLTPDFIQDNAALFTEAALLFLDANLPEAALAAAMQLAKDNNLPVTADPTSASLTEKFKPYLNQITLITPNHKEAGVLCEIPVTDIGQEQALEAAKHLVRQGVELAIITLAEFGVSYATSETSGHIPAIRTQIIDPTGGGDALSAAVVFALLNNISEDEAVRLGIAAASITLKHPGAVHPDLSLEMLYSHLT